MIPGGDVRLCEVEVWDGGEYVYCHAPATHRDVDGMWCCAEHPGRLVAPGWQAPRAEGRR